MTSKLSTDELFHFTSFENLKGIIRSGFFPKYNLEHTLLSNAFNRPAAVELIPMVCFCDIPLALVHEHSGKYGKCAIGLDKDWGNEFGLNPVIYVSPNSILGDAISALGNSFDGYKSSMIADASDISIFNMISLNFIGVRQLAYYVKQYEQLKEEHICFDDKHDHCLKTGRFYDEREWRYVPPNSWDDMWLLDHSTFFDKEKMIGANEVMKKHVLKFRLNHIQYIICETAEQKEELVNLIAEEFEEDKTVVEKQIKFKFHNEL